jgi:hypothetical protein
MCRQTNGNSYMDSSLSYIIVFKTVGYELCEVSDVVFEALTAIRM